MRQAPGNRYWLTNMVDTIERVRRPCARARARVNILSRREWTMCWLVLLHFDKRWTSTNLNVIIIISPAKPCLGDNTAFRRNPWPVCVLDRCAADANNTRNQNHQKRIYRAICALCVVYVLPAWPLLRFLRANAFFEEKKKQPKQTAATFTDWCLTTKDQLRNDTHVPQRWQRLMSLFCEAPWMRHLYNAHYS